MKVMDCTEARERILEADLAELRWTGDSALSKHLLRCSGCRGVAERILGDERTLAQELAKIAPRVSLGLGVASSGREWHQRRRIWTRLVPALAAAGLAAVLLTQVRISPFDRAPAPPGVTEALSPAPQVDPPSDRNVVVFGTDNPNIIIIWFY